MVGRVRRVKFQPLEFGALVLVCAALLAAPVNAEKKAAKQTFDEYEVKAVFLLNFSLYTEWPADAFADEQAPFMVGVLGDDPFGPKLEAALKDEKIKGRNVEIRRAKKAEDLKGCHIVFVGASEKPRLSAMLAIFSQQAVLTISDIEDFCRSCGVANFAVENDRVRLHINTAAAKAHGLKINSQLLSLAKIVECEALKGAP